jgi:NAD(P)-dependent dehydrogenase (short-subunit alcohol dehydrogenase family)
MNTLRDKVVVITGAASGIGRSLALQLDAEGARLALNDRDPDALRQTAAALSGTDVLQRSFDVSDRRAMEAFSAEVQQHFGQVDVVINNAGLGMGSYPFESLDLDLVEHIMAVNFNGVLYGSRYFAPLLLQRPESALVNISSVYGLAGIAQVTAYCASKFAVHGLNQCLMQEYAGTGLTVHSVHPGGINTNITRNSPDYKPEFDVFARRFLRMSPDKAAQVIIRGIQRKKQRILIGKEAYQIDVATRISPWWGGRMINRILERTRREIAAKLGGG